MNNITVQAELYRENGGWRLIIHAPRWLIGDFAREMQENKTRLVVASTGWPMDSDNASMLLVPYNDKRKAIGDGSQ